MIASIPPRGHMEQSQVAYWEDFLTNEEIALLLSLPQWHEKKAAEVGTIGDGKVNQDIRTTDVAWLHPCEKTKLIWQKIIHAVTQVNNKHFHFDLDGCYEPAQLGMYKSNDGGHYNWHIDCMGSHLTTPRKLSMALMLSDTSEFEGGDLQVKTINDNAETLEQKQGRAFFFPSYTLHRVAPVTKGVRRSLVMWFGGPPFK